MELGQFFHMKGGQGESSYALNSSIQKKIMSEGYSIIQEALEVVLANDVPESMGIADLGCSSGPNTLQLISDIIQIVYAITHKMGHPMPEIRVSLNDLHSNDFNNIFHSLPTLHNILQKETSNSLEGCYISGVPGSFYGRLFPRKSLHFIHSSSSLHWLSQVPRVPLNKGKVYISKSSPVSVVDAYRSQFQHDFRSFLDKRSEEMVSGGCMILSFLGRGSTDPTSEDCCYLWDLLAEALMSMASEGIFKEEMIYSFNGRHYAPSSEEVANEIEQEGSFIINHGVKALKIGWKECGKCDSSQSHGQKISKTMRAVNESIIASHFGNGITEDVFLRLAGLIDNYFLVNARPHSINLVMSLTRK